MITCDWSVEKIKNLQGIGLKLYPLKFSQKDGRKLFDFVDSKSIFPDEKQQKPRTWSWIKDYPHADPQKLYEYTLYGFFLAGILTNDIIVVDTDYKITYDDFIKKYKLEKYPFIERSVNYTPENCKGHILFSLKNHQDKLDKTLYKLHDFGIAYEEHKDDKGKKIKKSGELLVAANKNKFILMTGVFTGDISSEPIKEAPENFFSEKTVKEKDPKKDYTPDLPQESYFEDDTEIVKGLPIIQVAEKLGGKIESGNKMCCIGVDHTGDKAPSLQIYEDTNSFNCFGCGITGSVIDLVVSAKGYAGTKEAFDWLRNEFNIEKKRKKVKPKPRKTKYFKQENEEPRDVAAILSNIIKVVEPIDLPLEYEKISGESPPVKAIHRDGATEWEVKIPFEGEIGIYVTKFFDFVFSCQYKIRRTHGVYYIYNGNYWLYLQEDFIGKMLVDVCCAMGVNILIASANTFRKAIKTHFDHEFTDTEEKGSNEKTLINLSNCTIEFNEGQFVKKPFDYRDFLKYQLPYSYDPSTDCPKFREYLERVLPDNNVRITLQEFMGYVFTSYTELKLEKVLVLLGDGQNGKSVMYDVMRAVYGRDNCCAFSTDNLSQDYYKALLPDYLLNYSSEFGKGLEKDSFKQLASGEPIGARQAYGVPFIAENYAKMAFNTNTLPANVELNKAFFRRFLLIPFNVTITEEEKDPQLAKKIIESELSGVFNWVMEGLKRIMKQRKFTESKTSQKSMEEYLTSVDSVKRFIEDEDFPFNDRIETKILLKDIYSKYSNFAKESGNHPKTKPNFKIRMGQFGYNCERGAGNKVYMLDLNSKYIDDEKETPPWEIKNGDYLEKNDD